MFTGIVEEIGVVESVARAPGGHELRVLASKVVQDLKLGDSIAVNGACLTVVRFDSKGFVVGLSPETLRRTNLGEVSPGDRVNLERAVRPIDRLGGHYVQGHVDGVGVVVERRREGDSLLLRFTLAKELSRYVVEKGFIAVDGISLTVTGCGDGWFTVSLIPFTQRSVALSEKGVGAKVNIEVDIIGKYIESLIAARERRGGITTELLAERGFL